MDHSNKSQFQYRRRKKWNKNIPRYSPILNSFSLLRLMTFLQLVLKQKFIQFLLSFNSNKPKELYKNEYISLSLTHSLTLGFVRRLPALETFSFHRLGSFFIAFKVLSYFFSLHSASRFEFKYFQNKRRSMRFIKRPFFLY